MAQARPSTAEFNAFLAPDEFRERGEEVELTPASAGRLALGLRWANSRGRKAHVSRARFASVGQVDITSCLIRAEAEAKVSQVEAVLERSQLTLGPLSPCTRGLSVAGWLSGRRMGMRSVPGGRLESAALALEAVLWSGEVYRSHATPRSATGPDLDFALLGAGDAVGLITSAVLRGFPRPTTEDRTSIALGAAAQAAQVLRDLIGHEALPARAELSLHEGRPVLSAVFENLAFRAHRDAGRLRAVAALHGAAESKHAVPKLDEARLLREFEVAWDALPAVLELCAPAGAGLYRLARESVVVCSALELEGDGVVPLDAPPESPGWLTQMAASLRGEG